MTVTISRLYYNYRDAQQAVRRLEAAGVPHSTSAWSPIIRTVGSTPTRRTAATMVSMIAQKGLARAPESVPASVAQPAFLPGSACWRSLD